MLSVIMILVALIMLVTCILLVGITVATMLIATSYFTLGFISPLLGLILGTVALYKSLKLISV